MTGYRELVDRVVLVRARRRDFHGQTYQESGVYPIKPEHFHGMASALLRASVAIKVELLEAVDGKIAIAQITPEEALGLLPERPVYLAMYDEQGHLFDEQVFFNKDELVNYTLDMLSDHRIHSVKLGTQEFGADFLKNIESLRGVVEKICD